VASSVAGAVRDERADLRREQIITCATRLFGSRGSTDVSMDEVATEAGVARSTIYVYFPNRSALLVACIAGLYDQLMAAVNDAELTEPRERLVSLIGALLATIDSQPAFFRLAIATQGLPGQAGDAVTLQLAGIGVEISSLVETILVDGVARLDWTVEDPAQTASLIGQQIYGALAVRAMEVAPLNPMTVAEAITGFLVDGLTGRRPANVR
jgi:TetR/AcrR family fatty acid metabolism transcriptional regulator